MTSPGGALSYVAVGLTLLACGSAAGSFRPYSAVIPAGEGITPEAVEVLEGDVKHLDDVPTAIVGTVVVTGHDKAELEHKAACIAAKNGGTHIVQRARWSSISGTHSTLFVTGNQAFAATRVDTVERAVPRSTTATAGVAQAARAPSPGGCRDVQEAGVERRPRALGVPVVASKRTIGGRHRRLAETVPMMTLDGALREQVVSSAWARAAFTFVLGGARGALDGVATP